MTSFDRIKVRAPRVMDGAMLAALPAALSLCLAATAQAATAPTVDANASLHETWRASLARVKPPHEGCFHASFPNASWQEVACSTKPATPYIPRSGHSGFTVGNGNDYSAVVTGIISQGVGSFPSVTGVTKETGYGGSPNTYSLQLNSQFFKSAACSGAATPSKCLGWQQFVYSSSEGIAFMQYWLINYGSKCPKGAGWASYSGSCYKNSAEVSVPNQLIAQLANLAVTGAATVGGSDTIMLTTASDAYSASGLDTVVDLGVSWDAAEFNIVGDGGGSNAKFNKKSTVTVNIALSDGLTAAPTCKANAGTTGETNNLTLGACTTSGGPTPSVQFTEAN